MPVTSAELQALLNELGNTLPRRLEKVYQTDEKEVWLVFRENKNQRLCLNTDPPVSSLFLTERREKFPEKPSPFAGLLRKRLSGQRLEEVQKQPGDRLTAFLFRPTGYVLYARFYSSGGFLLCTPDGKVEAAQGWTGNPALKPGDSFAMPDTGTDAPEENPFTGSPSATLEERFLQSVQQRRQTAALADVNREIKKNKKQLASMQKEKEQLSRWADSKKQADTLAANFHRIRRGDDGITLPDLETGDEMRIPLQPDKSPQENMQLLYKRDRKYRKGMERLAENIKETDAKLAELHQEKEAIESGDAAAVTERQPTGTKPAAQRRKNRPEKKGPFRRFTTEQGFEVYVGRNDKENDLLVKESNGNDLWFHVRGFPGSHTVLKTKGKKDIPYPAVMEAARMALKYSSRAGDGKGIVVYTHIKNVKRPKNAPPGKVTITHEKTVDVRL